MYLAIPKHVSRIIDILDSHGYEACIVGGCVRDFIMGRVPADWDVTTSARPDQIRALFRHTIDTGAKHGTVTVMTRAGGVEVTTWRRGGHYAQEGGADPDPFADQLSEDLMYRDFTINAMAYNEEEGLIDLFGGLHDLKDGRIRCSGNPDDRFREDPLRMLRAIRFAGQLGFTIDPETRAAIIRNKDLLTGASAERILMELMKILISDHPDILKEAYETGLTGVFLPEFDPMMKTPQNNPHHKYTVGEHTLHALTCIEANPILRLAILFHDIGKPLTRTTDEEGIDHFHGHNQISADLAEEILKRLRSDNRTIRMVSKLISWHDTRFWDPAGEGRSHVRHMIYHLSPALFPYLLKVMEADVSAQSSYMQEEKLRLLKETQEVYQEILERGDCLSLKDLAINGHQLKGLGIREGKTIGTILGALLSAVLDHPELNEPAVLEKMALKLYQQIRQP